MNRKANGTFRRDWLPSWEAYAMQQDIALRGPGVEKRARCTIHGGERDSLSVNVATGAWCCHACGASGADVLAYHRAVHGAGFIEAARALGAWAERDDDDQPRQRPAKAHSGPVAAPAAPERGEDADAARKRAQAARLWAQSRTIERDTPAGIYLLGRNCVLPPGDSDLRWLPDVREYGFSGPALVGRMSLALDHRVMTGLHVTWLRCTGEGWVRGERRYFGPKKGALVRVWCDEGVATGLAVAEGVETALSMARHYTPVWSAMDAGNLAALPALAGIECLVIGADHDDAGLKAATACADRWSAAGVDVRVITPERERSDWNDERPPA